MSASEKLKSLDERATARPWEYHAGLPPWEPPVQMTGSVWAHDDYRPMMEKPRTFDAELIVALRNALPQIVAVIEAAEAVEFQQHEPWSPEYQDITDSLAALEKVLE